MGHISFVGKLDAIALSAGAPPFAPGFTLEQMARHSLDFWLTSEDLPDPDNRVTLDRDGGIVLSYTPNNDDGTRAPDREAEAPAHASGLPSALHSADAVRRPADSARRRRASERDDPLRPRSAHVGARRPLQGARRRQSLRRRRQLLRVERGGESGADDRRERLARRRSPARTARRERARA